MGIFVLDGLLVGLVGTVIGLVLGVVLALNVNAVAAAFKLNSALGQILTMQAEVPSRILVGDLVLVAAVAMLCSVSASVLPAWRAARADPIESLRHE